MASSLSPNFPKTTIYMPPPLAPLIATMPAIRSFPDRGDSHPYFHWREPDVEDDNISAAKEIKRQNRRNKIQHFVKRCLPFTKLDPGGQPAANLAPPQARPFRWMISSYHTPEEYQAARFRRHSPWLLLLRCMLIDLSEQLESGLGTSTCWRDCQVQEKGEIKFLRRMDSCGKFPQLKWGRRIVFSEQTKDEPRWLTGRWLIVAYLWSDSRGWLETANVGSLLSLQSAFCIRAYERLSCLNCTRDHHLKYRQFYQSEKVPDKPERLVTLFRHNRYYFGPQPPPIPPDTPVPDELSKQSRLMNKEAIALLYTPSKKG
ncbi:hypothetical protein QBC47DRAFT_58754 [Echria macrotheca]|uniref:Uncharacterized protein n=1 Tax=Echria macrotheca TaxID=438768 RepID=A0AAJ0B775_9PEZI|nr:hypothetical protein QBC47DRAFT_58754 [Echria macrotheca]